MIIDGFTFEGVTPGEFLGKYQVTLYRNGEELVTTHFTLSDLADKILILSNMQWPEEDLRLRIEKPVHLTGKFFKRGVTFNAEENGPSVSDNGPERKPDR